MFKNPHKPSASSSVQIENPVFLKQRIIMFICSPIADEEKDVVKIAKKLKKEKVNIDIISFGEDECNNEKLATFINTLNGADGSRYYYC